MLRLALLVVALAALSGCLSDTTRPDGPVTLTRLTPSGTSLPVSGYDRPARLVITNSRDFAGAWERAFAAGTVPPRPNVDFDRNIVVIAALGARGASDASFEVAGAKLSGGKLLVEVRTRIAGAHCGVAQMPITPADIVKLPRVSSRASFVEDSQVIDCPVP